MSSQDERLRKALKDFHRPAFSTIAAEVLEVDLAELTVDVLPLDGGAEIFGVRLRAAIDEDRNGLVVVPTKGSTVLVSAINDNWNSAYVAMVSTVQKMILSTEQESLHTLLKDIVAEVRALKFATNTGPTVALLTDPQWLLLSDRIDNLLAP